VSRADSMLRAALRKGRRLGEPHLLRFAHSIERGFGRVPAPPAVTARSVCAVDVTTGATLLAKNAWLSSQPASLTKLATSMLLAEVSQGRWNEPVEVQEEDLFRGSKMGLAAGDVITRLDVLYGMILPSGNDAAMVAARLIGPRWLDGMNSLAARLGMPRTRFLSPHGWDVPGQYSTGRDLARLAAAAFAVPPIRVAAGTSHYEVHVRGSNARILALASTVRMLGEPHIVAGKTGTTRSAQACLALLVEKESTRAVVVIMGATVALGANGVVEASDRRYDDARAIVAAL
jgi:serine-type D-Ala-D-Ala carboxypeptidase (penicillin-binding protein 5/6)